MGKIISILLCILIAVPGYADIGIVKCAEPVQLLNHGDKAPCTGFLFSPEQEKKVYEATQDAKYYKELSDKLMKRQELQTEQLQIMDERLKLYMNQSNTLAIELQKEKSDSFWKKTLYFGLGIIVTGVAVSAAKGL